MKVGDTVWTFDGNRRVYAKGHNHRPIYREHFKAETIIGETRDSWIIGPTREGWKVNKKTQQMREAQYGLSRRVYFSQQEVDDDVYVHDTRASVMAAVAECQDAAVLRQIAALLNVAGDR